MSKQDRSCCDTPFKTMCGGQALIEGIMMQGPKKRSIVVRKPDGELEIKTTPLHPLKERYPVLGLPLIRGVVGFGATMVSGVKALMYSADVAGDEEAEEEELTAFEIWLQKHFSSETVMKVIVTISVLLGAGLSVGLFILLPTLLGGLAAMLPFVSLWAQSIVEGLSRVVIFMGYLFLCSRMKEMRRIFSYHGAEHKTIYCYENGLELTVENVRKQPRHHPRCGTSFLFVVIMVSILVSVVVFTPLEISNTLVRMGLHLLLLPLIVGITYELNHYVGGHSNPVTRFLSAPGLFMQNFTTFEPDDSMIEVGIAALKEVLPENRGEDAW